jgi:hypothetical protein
VRGGRVDQERQRDLRPGHRHGHRAEPALEEAPELANADPYGEGWMFEVRPDDPGEVEGLLSAEEYQAGLG